MTIYACLLRPPHWSTLPDGYLSYDPTDTRGAFGTVTYSTPLDTSTARHFSLVELPADTPIRV